MKVQKTEPEIIDHGWNSGTMGMSQYRRRSNITIAVIVFLGTVLLAGIAALVVLLLSQQPQARADYDPYAYYLDHKPDGAPNLTPEFARMRAFLGCDQIWVPGTVDYVLAEAYAPTDLCDK